jgi:hypothetical protein
LRRQASVAVCIALWVFHAAAEPIELSSRRIAFGEEPVAVPQLVGKLEFRGGLHLTSPDRRFGGWSGMISREGGAELIAVSDGGHWLILRPRYDRAGNLDGVAAQGEIEVLRDPIGNPVRRSRRDAEEIAWLPEGIAVAFEADHRIWLYPHGGKPFALPPQVIDAPLGLWRAPTNQGVEALTGLADGRLLAITEGLFASTGLLQGWVSEGPPHRNWAPVTWPTVGEFLPTGAAKLPNGDVLVLERRFSWIGGLASRIARISAHDIRPGSRLSGEEVARLEVPLVHENFEGIAVTQRGKETLVYLISDDNYNSILQRTLLVMFVLSP